MSEGPQPRDSWPPPWLARTLLPVFLLGLLCWTGLLLTSWASPHMYFVIVPGPEGALSVNSRTNFTHPDNPINPARPADSRIVSVMPFRRVQDSYDTTFVLDHTLHIDDNDPPLSVDERMQLGAQIVAAIPQVLNLDPRWKTLFLAGDGQTSFVRWQGYVGWATFLVLIAGIIYFGWRSLPRRLRAGAT
jgi:hypothetical protein